MMKAILAAVLLCAGCGARPPIPLKVILFPPHQRCEPQKGAACRHLAQSVSIDEQNCLSTDV